MRPFPDSRRLAALPVAALVLSLAAPVGVLAATPASGAEADTDADTGTATIDATIDELCEQSSRGVFRDVAGIHRDSIDCLSGYDVTVGVGGGNYDPAGSVRREQMASFLVNFVEVASGDRQPDPGEAPFGDVAGSVHARNIAIAAELGITSGLDADTFGPARRVTREQMATFVVNTIEAAGVVLPVADGATPFTDVVGEVHADSIGRLAEAKVVVGIGDGLFDPSGEVGRAQMATFLVNTAAFLHLHGAWGAGVLPADVPHLLHVARDGASLDTVRLLWDREVEATGDVEEIQVFNGSATALASGQNAVQVDADATRIVLDAALAAGDDYRLHVPAGFVEDAAEAGNLAQSVDFTFTLAGDGSADDATGVAVSTVSVDGDTIADGGSVDVDTDMIEVTGVASATGSTVDDVEVRRGATAWEPADPTGEAFDSAIEPFALEIDGLTDGTHDVEVRSANAAGDVSDIWTIEVIVEIAPVPTIESVTTNPGDNSLVVVFSEPVTCPDNETAWSAWDFRNLGDPGDSSGAPSSVVQDTESADTCELVYSTGIHNGEYGTISYVDPSGSDAISTASNGDVPSDSYIEVGDGVAPQLMEIRASASPGPSMIAVSFSEPVLCQSLDFSDFAVFLDGADVSDELTGFDCTDEIEPGLLLENQPIALDAVVVVRIIGEVYDLSQDNFVEMLSHETTNAT